MKINLKYTVALNILFVCDIYRHEKITANFINRTTGSDLTTIRQVMFLLKKAGYIENKPGPGGTRLAKELSEITLFDVYAAVLDPAESMLRFYEADNGVSDSLCGTIRHTVDMQFNAYRDLLFNEMKRTTAGELCGRIKAEKQPFLLENGL